MYDVAGGFTSWKICAPSQSTPGNLESKPRSAPAPGPLGRCCVNPSTGWKNQRPLVTFRIWKRLDLKRRCVWSCPRHDATGWKNNCWMPEFWTMNSYELWFVQIFPCVAIDGYIYLAKSQRLVLAVFWGARWDQESKLLLFIWRTHHFQRFGISKGLG